MSEFSKVFFQHCKIRKGIGYIDYEDGDYDVFYVTELMELTRASTMLEF